MPTTNYNLPTLTGTEAFNFAEQYNALASATDTALASLAGTIPTDELSEIEGNISALQTLTATHTSSINQLTANITTANSNISALDTRVSTVESSLGTVNSDISSLESSVSATSASVTTLQQTISNAFTMETTQYSSIGTNLSGSLFVSLNTNNSWIKVYGKIATTGTANRVAVPGVTLTTGASVYGVATSIYTDITGDVGYYVRYTGVREVSDVLVDATGYCISNEGRIYIFPAGSSTTVPANYTVYYLNELITLGTPVTGDDTPE